MAEAAPLPGLGDGEAWSTNETAYFGEGRDGTLQQAMINYRVDDLEGLLAQLTAAGVWVGPQRDDYDFGRFAWIRDCDGNRLELWQPLVSD